MKILIWSWNTKTATLTNAFNINIIILLIFNSYCYYSKTVVYLLLATSVIRKSIKEQIK